MLTPSLLTRVDFNKLHNAWLSVLATALFLHVLCIWLYQLFQYHSKSGVDSMAYFHGYRRLYLYE